MPAEATLPAEEGNPLVSLSEEVAVEVGVRRGTGLGLRSRLGDRSGDFLRERSDSDTLMACSAANLGSKSWISIGRSWHTKLNQGQA
jgi:hypothetical protein